MEINGESGQMNQVPVYLVGCLRTGGTDRPATTAFKVACAHCKLVLFNGEFINTPHAETAKCPFEEPMIDPLQQAMFLIQEWTMQANQLTVLNNEKASKIIELENSLIALSRNRQKDFRRHQQLETAYRELIETLESK